MLVVEGRQVGSRLGSQAHCGASCRTGAATQAPLTPARCWAAQDKFRKGRPRDQTAVQQMAQDAQLGKAGASHPGGSGAPVPASLDRANTARRSVVAGRRSSVLDRRKDRTPQVDRWCSSSVKALWLYAAARRGRSTSQGSTTPRAVAQALQEAAGRRGPASVSGSRLQSRIRSRPPNRARWLLGPFR